MMKVLATATLFTLLAWQPVSADDDIAKGEKLFTRCAACHSIKDDKNKIGPTLKGVVGRAPGTVAGFVYSNAMLEFAKSNSAWDEKTLDIYLANPRDLIKGTKMSLAPIKKDDERRDIIAYLKSMTP